MKTLEEFGKDSEKQIEEARLNANELLNVEGGVDVDLDNCLLMSTCISGMCISAGGATCYTGAG
jgi:hypothetical protein